jgi:anti-sigma-K factor RskA
MMTALPDDILDLLAAYALGALEPEEITQVSALLAEHPELRSTLAQLRATADRLPYALPEATPPPDLRQRVLDYATGRNTAPRPAADGALRRARAWIWSFAGIAVVALLAAAIGWAQLFSAQGELARSQVQLNQMQAQIAAAERVIASLQGQSGSAAIVQTRAGTTLLVAQLPPLQPGRVYQLWRIQGNNPPANAGIFTVDPQGYGQAELAGAQNPQSGETVAVTDEPGPTGSPGPTTQPLVAGKSG